MTITLLTPTFNETVSTRTDDQRYFLSHRQEETANAENIDWLNLIRKGEEQSLPAPVLCTWKLSEPLAASDSMLLYLSSTEDFSDPRIFPCNDNQCALYHLYLGADYYWRVSVLRNGRLLAQSSTHRFTVAWDTPRSVRAGGLSNVRDIGGFSTKDGKRVRQGMIFRGCEMEFHHTITEDGRRVLREELGIRTDLDLRMEAAQAEMTASALGENVDFVLIPCAAYDRFLEDQETAARLFRVFTNPSRYPIYAHCWGGADRTGTLILLLSALLGVKEEDLFADYEFTSLSIWGKRSIRSDLFQAFLAELNRYGAPDDSINKKCEVFLLSCGITPEEIHTFRRIMTEP